MKNVQEFIQYSLSWTNTKTIKNHENQFHFINLQFNLYKIRFSHFTQSPYLAHCELWYIWMDQAKEAHSLLYFFIDFPSISKTHSETSLITWKKIHLKKLSYCTIEDVNKNLSTFLHRHIEHKTTTVWNSQIEHEKHKKRKYYANCIVSQSQVQENQQQNTNIIAIFYLHLLLFLQNTIFFFREIKRKRVKTTFKVFHLLAYILYVFIPKVKARRRIIVT